MHQHIVFVGAGGAGVSSLVLLFQELGIPHIIAIDSHESELTKKLQSAGIRVIIGHGNYEMQQDDIIIYSDAAAESPEVLAAHEKALLTHKKVFPPMSYFEFLGEISKYMQTVAIAGTHGKSTTTALAATALAKHHPLFGLGIVGAPINQWDNRNFCLGDTQHHNVKAIVEHILFPKGPPMHTIMKKTLFVVEADEYNHHFLHLDSDYAVITNIELDHADVYGTFNNYLATFTQFANKVKKKIFVLPTEPGIQDFTNTQIAEKIITVTPHNFDFTHLLGAHNHTNAALALSCTTYLCGTDKITANKQSSLATDNLEEKISLALATFQGLRRRGELLGYNTHQVPIITDYGHHPTELASTLSALREKYPNKHITCLFQPHQARRVMEFRDAFVRVLQQFDTTIIYNIYAAREDLVKLKQQFAVTNHLQPDYIEDAPDFSHLSSIDDLGHQFAVQAQAKYTNNFTDIQDTLDTTEKGVIIIFAAGSLDWEIRKYLSI